MRRATSAQIIELVAYFKLEEELNKEDEQDEDEDEDDTPAEERDKGPTPAVVPRKNRPKTGGPGGPGTGKWKRKPQ
jgi:hypothetical protein